MSDVPNVDPRLDRYLPLVRSTRVAVVVATSLALLSVVVPDPFDRVAAATAISVVLVAPLVRVCWLARRWFRRGDTRYGWVAVGVLCVVAVAVLLASL